MQLKSIENKLLKAIEGYKDTKNIQQQLESLATAEGLEGDDLTAVVGAVMTRLKNTEKPKKGSKFGKAHNPNKQYANLVQLIQSMRY